MRPASQPPSSRRPGIRRFGPPLAVLTLAAFLSGVGPARADGIVEPGEIEAARALVQALTDPAGVERARASMRERFRERMVKVNKGKAAEIDALFDAVVLPELDARFTAIMERRAEAMARSMTPAQIQANLVFWQGPTGQAVLAVPRSDGFEDRIFDGMKDRLGLVDGLALRNRMSDLGDAVRQHVEAAKAASGTGN